MMKYRKQIADMYLMTGAFIQQQLIITQCKNSNNHTVTNAKRLIYCQATTKNYTKLLHYTDIRFYISPLKSF